MEDVLTETVPTEELRRLEEVYHEQLYKNDVTNKAQFEYSWCLVRSKYPADIKKGLVLLQELYNIDHGGQRDYLYYLAFGNARIKEYTKALSFVRAFLTVEPGNQQVISLEAAIKKRMDREGLVGMAVAGGLVLAVGAVVGLGMAIAKK